MTEDQQYEVGKQINKLLLEYNANCNEALEVYATLMGWIAHKEGVKPKELGLYVGTVAHEIAQRAKVLEGEKS